MNETTELTRPITFIYVAALTDDYWFIGRTSDLDAVGTLVNDWLVLHPILALVDWYEETGPEDVDLTTLEWMRRYGRDRVRGGYWSAVDLPHDHCMDGIVAAFRRMINSFGNI